MKNTYDYRELALSLHQRLPERIKTYLNSRGIPEAIICRYRLGWNGDRITIPITNRDREVPFFKLAAITDEQTSGTELGVSPTGNVELFGWERVLLTRERIVICEGEFDRLILEAHGIAAVTSTAGADTFLARWAEEISTIPNVFICFHHDAEGNRAAEDVATLIPHSRVAHLPDEVGEGGTLEHFFGKHGRTVTDFETLLDAARPLPENDTTRHIFEEPESRHE